jgi:hypothetical protein
MDLVRSSRACLDLELGRGSGFDMVQPPRRRMHRYVND